MLFSRAYILVWTLPPSHPLAVTKPWENFPSKLNVFVTVALCLLYDTHTENREMTTFSFVVSSSCCSYVVCDVHVGGGARAKEGRGLKA